LSRRFAHEAKASEVTMPGVDPREVKVAKGSTRSRYDLRELLLLLVPKVVLLPVVALAVVVPLCVVILVGGGVELLPLRAVGDEVGGVTTLDASPRRSPPLLA
jgi:hypothetical protein